MFILPWHVQVLSSEVNLQFSLKKTKMFGMVGRVTVDGTKMVTGLKICPDLLMNQPGGTTFLERNLTHLFIFSSFQNHFVLHLHDPNRMLENNRQLFFDLVRITPFSGMVSLGIVTLTGMITGWIMSSM